MRRTPTTGDHGLRIAYFVHGRGRGHASRAISLVPALREQKHEVAVYGGHDADDLLRGLDDYHEITPILPGFRSIGRIPGRLIGDRKKLKAQKAELLISDGDAPSLVAARTLNIPAIAIGHSLIFTRCHLPEGLTEWALKAQRKSAYWATHWAQAWVAVHFLPLRAAHEKAWLTQPVPLLTEEQATREEHITCYFRDANGHKILQCLSRMGIPVHCFGQPDSGLPNVQFHPFERRRFVESLCCCRAVFTSAGSNLLAESVHLKKPVFALYRADDSEQQLNAEMIQAEGMGHSSSFHEFSQQKLEDFLALVESDQFSSIQLKTPDLITGTLQAIQEISG